MHSLILAYIDPGAGSALLQLLLAGVAGAGLLLRLFGRRVREKFGRRARAANGSDTGNDR